MLPFAKPNSFSSLAIEIPFSKLKLIKKEVQIIGNQKLEIKEFNGQRVVTFKDIDLVHERAEGTARRNFNQNKTKLIKDEDYFVRNSHEAKAEFGIIAPNGLILLTEQGYLMLVKSFTDDLAWKVQRQLVNNYFKHNKQEQNQSQSQSMSMEDIIIYQMQQSKLMKLISNVG